MRNIGFGLCAAVTVLLGAPFGSGCVEEACTLPLIFSVTVTVVDPVGAPVTGATVTVTDDGVESPCQPNPTGDNVFLCGEEQDGDLLIRVTHPGFATSEREVHVGANECHVEPETVTIAMSPN